MKRFSSFISAEHSSYNYVKSLFRDVCQNSETQFSKMIYRYDDLRLSNLSINPEDYEDVETFKRDYALTKFLSKWKGLKTGIDTEKVALSAFEKQESINAVTNARLESASGSIVDPIIHRASRIVANVLGEFNWDAVRSLGNWGKGATTDLIRRRAQLDLKIGTFPIPVSYRARLYLEQEITEDIHWSSCLYGQIPGPHRLLNSSFLITNSSKVITVSKNSKTDRTIAIEPRGNMFLQKACGSYIRKRLKKYGIDLDDQSINQNYAKSALADRLATIDLSMASDSVTKQLVWLLLPFEWASILDTLRSSHYYFDNVSNGEKEFEKFSSMGNGFTFELETLIFYALVKASLEDESDVVSIYGDDIICPQKDAAVVISTLNYCGFSVNIDKTYVEGNFFESCGKHYFKGIDVTPIYQKENLDDGMEVLRLLNRVARYSLRCYLDGDKLYGPWHKAWSERLASLRKRFDLPLVPFGTEGDDGFLVNHSRVELKSFTKTYGYKFVVVLLKPVKVPAYEEPLLAYALRRGTNNTRERFCLDIDRRLPFNGELESRSSLSSASYRVGYRWIDPSWEFATD